MRFLIHEYNSIKALAESKSLFIDDFSFTKRKGKLFIGHNSIDTEFILHRKTETILVDKNYWKKRNTYQIIQPTTNSTIDNWNEVLKEIEKWMDTISA